MVPAGSPDSVTFTALLKPFWPVVDIVNVELELPAAAVTVGGEATMLKSWTGGGGGSDLAPPPHVTRPSNKDPMQRIRR